VLLDVARRHGVESLEPGHAIGPDDIEGCLTAQSVTVEPGDILLFRTGYLARCRARGWADYHTDMPGLGRSCLEWLHERQVAAVATDTASLEVRPFDDPDTGVPFHAVAIVYMGLLLGEIFDFEALAEDCAADGRYAFLFVAPPLPVTTGVGSPANPYAIK
jgi:kynurenine formamidase